MATLELSASKKNKIRKLAIESVRPEGWSPKVGDTVFVPRTIVEYVETRDQYTGAAISTPRNATTMRPGVHVAEVVSRSIDPDLVTVREPRNPGRSELKQKLVLVSCLRPFRGWEIEVERLPPKKPKSKKAR